MSSKTHRRPQAGREILARHVNILPTFRRKSPNSQHQHFGSAVSTNSDILRPQSRRMTTRTAATASLSSFGTSTSSSSSCVFDHANRPTKAEARAVRPRAVSCEVVGPGWVDVCCLSNRVSSQFSLFIISEEWSASSVCTQPSRLRVRLESCLLIEARERSERTRSVLLSKH